MSEPSDVWRRHAAQWSRVGPPLRPCAADGALLDAVITAWVAAHGVPSGLVLGVTPEMARLGWPAGTDLLAVDRSSDMIERVWPGYPRPGEGALLADWRALPLPDASRDLIVGDGSFSAVPWLGVPAMVRQLRRVIAPHGRLAFRNFVRPEAKERPADVYDAVLAGEIGSFHAFKLRLLMAVQTSTAAGVVTGDVWTSWDRHGPGAKVLADRLGWPIEQVATIDAYRGQDTVYGFPTLAELRAELAGGGFEEIAHAIPPYELGERCPTLVFRRGHPR